MGSLIINSQLSTKQLRPCLVPCQPVFLYTLMVGLFISRGGEVFPDRRCSQILPYFASCLVLVTMISPLHNEFAYGFFKSVAANHQRVLFPGFSAHWADGDHVNGVVVPRQTCWHEPVWSLAGRIAECKGPIPDTS